MVVASVAWGDSWVITDAPSLKSGDVVVITGTNANGTYGMSNNNGTSSAPGATAVTIDGDKLSSIASVDNLQWTVTVGEINGERTYEFAAGSNKLYCTNTNNGVRVGTNDNKTFVFKDNYLYNSATSRYIGIYNNADWRCYTSINNNIKDQTFAFYKKTSDGKADANLSFSPSSVTIHVGETMPQITFSNPNNLDVVFASSNNNVAVVSTDGTISLVNDGMGQAVITASSEETENYSLGNATCTINVLPIGGTLEDPLTVEEANIFISTLENKVNSEYVYVRGIVSALGEFSSEYGNYVYYISDDGTETNQLEVYRGKYLENANFTSANQLTVGDKVIVYGPLVNFNGTYEFTTGNYIYAFENNLAKCDLSFDKTAVSVELNSEFTAPTLNNPHELSVSYSSSNTDVAKVDATSGDVTILKVGETTITASFAGNDSYEEGSASYVLTVTDPSAVTVAVLPFEWAGGASANFLALDGVTAEGLGTSDYGETHNPYNIKLDTTGDYIQVNTDSQPGKVIVGVKMVGGATASTITVQESADGVNFTNVQALSISGKQNDILTLETTNAFAADSRYVRLTFTKGSNVGVGPIKITKPATEIVAEETLEIDARATSGEIAYSIAYPQAGVDLTAAADVDWISGVTVASDKVTLTTTVNTGAERSGNITLTYGTLKKVVRVTQAAAPQMYTLTIGNPENVTITATYNVDQVINNGESAELENGTEVTFALTIPEGYALENVTVAGEEEGQAVEPTENATTPGVYTFTMPAFNVTINATVAKIETTTYTLATSVTPGKRYIIVGVNENTYKAMGEQKSNNRAAVEISVNDKTATVPSTAGAYEFVIDGNATDGYTIYDEVTPGYLYAAGGTKNNYLKTEEVPDESGNGTWTIEFDAEAKSAIIKSKNTEDNMRNWIRFNNSSSLFSCYASGQEDVYLYEKEVKGDVNKDGHITIADVTALVNIILGKVTAENNPDNYNFDAADVNNDGSPTIADVTELVNIILGKKN